MLSHEYAYCLKWCFEDSRFWEEIKNIIRTLSGSDTVSMVYNNDKPNSTIDVVYETKGYRIRINTDIQYKLRSDSTRPTPDKILVSVLITTKTKLHESPNNAAIQKLILYKEYKNQLFPHEWVRNEISTMLQQGFAYHLH